MQVAKEQIEKSLARKNLLVNKTLQDTASLINGLAKIKVYLLEEKGFHYY